MPIADQLLEELEPILTTDFEQYLAAIVAMFAEVEQYTLDTDDGDGWSILLDVDRCPAKALPFLGQMIGVDVPVGMAEADARALIRDRPQWRRGTPSRMIEVAQATLTGSKFVDLIERSAAACPADPAYGVTVVTRTSETTDPAVTLAALLAAKPAGLVLLHIVSDFPIIDEGSRTLNATSATIDAASFGDVT